MSPTTAFRLPADATQVMAERHIRRLTQRLRVPSVADSPHLTERYRTERDQWQRAIDDANDGGEQ